MGEKIVVALAGAAMSVLATGCGVAGASQIAGDPPLQKAYDTCTKDVSAPDSVTVGDGGHSVLIDGLTSGDVDGFVVMGCILGDIDTPESITAQMDATTALMGYQEAEANGFSYGWSYHPDSGVNMTITD